MSNAIHLNKFGVKSMVRKSIIALMSFSMMGVFSVNVHAQEESTESKDNSKDPLAKERRYGSYLAVTHAKADAEQNLKRNRRLIGDLQVIVLNFGSNDQKKKLTDVSLEYKLGVKELYRRRYLEANDTLASNKKNIAALYTEMVTLYHNKVVAILGRCTNELVEMELSINKTGNVSPTVQSGRTKKVHQNLRRLDIAYNQYNEGVFYRNENGYSYAIKHYRVAITQGISILMDVTESQEERKKYVDEFRVELLDVENRVAKQNKSE